MSAATKPIPRGDAAWIASARHCVSRGDIAIPRAMVIAALERLDDVAEEARKLQQENTRYEQLLEQLYVDAQEVSGSSAILFNRIIAARGEAPRPHNGG